jgi:hypothetical protein
MCRKQRAYNEAQEACIARRRAEALDAADKVNSAAGAVPGMAAGITGDVGDAAAAKAARKLPGAAGRVIGPAAAAAGYDADRNAGVPKDEAIIRNGVPLALGAATLLAPEGTPLWAAAAAELGVAFGAPPGAQALARHWGRIKDHVRYDPYWRDRVSRATNPFYLMDRLARRP